jgi:hypothetical protein
MEFIEGGWEQPEIKIDSQYTYPAYTTGFSRMYLMLGNMNGCEEDEILYILNHELDHWAQKIGGKCWRGTLQIKQFYQQYDILERCNAFSQVDWWALYLKTEMLRDMRVWAKNGEVLTW